MIGVISEDGIEVGSLPGGAGFELVRWNGTELIDLSTLSAIYVVYINGVFELHCIQVPNSQLVQMRYKDRKKLWNDNGVYKIKSDEQKQKEINLQYRRSHYPLLSDQMGEIIKYLATKTDLPPGLQKIVDDIENVKTEFPTTLEVSMQ